MADIGRIAGVSASTVSRALRGHPSIPERTRARILKIARENDYVLDTRAQNFRLGRSQTIATVFPYVGESRRSISDPFYLEMLSGIADELEHYGYDLTLSRVPSDDASWCDRYVLNKRVDGLIIIDRALDDPSLARLQELDANFVVFGPPLEGQTYVSVGGHSYEGGLIATQYLLELGRQRVGFIGGHETMVETHLRHRGYRAALRNAGIDYDERLVVYTDFSPHGGAAAAAELLAVAPDLDAVFACSDFTAMAAMQVFAEAGYRVPEDISVVGYDDVPLAAHSTPPLTTIRQETYFAGRLLVRKLFQLIEGDATESERVPIKLMVRESTAAR